MKEELDFAHGEIWSRKGTAVRLESQSDKDQL